MDYYVELSFDGILTSNTICRETAKSEGHSYGISYALLTDRDSLLLQQRSFKKASQPGLLDISAGGHVELCDTEGVVDIQGAFQKTAIRELKEELGISVNRKSLKFLTKFYEENKASNQRRYRKHYRVYTYEVDKDKLNIKYDENEVANIRWMTRKEVINLPVRMITKELERIQKILKSD